MTDDPHRPAATPTGDPWLLTPGPLTTSPEVKRAMLHDLGSRDSDFIGLNASMCERLTTLAGGTASHVCVPLQGSGTFAVEAMLGTLVPPEGGVLVLVNGAYGRRMVRICEAMGRRVHALEWPEDTPVDPAAAEAALAEAPELTHAAVVHCETTSGILNPLEAVAAAVARRGRGLLVDAMSTFGALPLDLRTTPCQAVAASANKCLEGVPGLAFCLVERAALEAAAGRAHSLSLDLHDQWTALRANGQWRFTPPTHVLLALGRALDELAAEGGVAGRRARYAANCRRLVEGMRAMGFRPLLPEALRAPVIVTFLMPADPGFAFEAFYEKLRRRGYVIYPGKVTVADSFRIGCIGRIGAAEIDGVLAAVGAVLAEMGVESGAPAATA